MEQKDTDIAIMQYLKEQPCGNFDYVIANDSRWEIFYHLSEMRKALLNWYDFATESSLLEIGGGFGALTGLFCEKCKQVVSLEKDSFRADAMRARHDEKKNLQIVCQDVWHWDSHEKFDYIVLVGILETICKGSQNHADYRKFLCRIKKWLKPKGKLLIAVENRFGIRYWCGAIDRHTQKPYAGINRYPGGSKGTTFDRENLRQIIQSCGLESVKFFYPLPDYIVPQLIYSDEYLPVSSIKERVIPYYLNQEYLVAFENDLYDDIVNNHVFQFLANSFLVESSVQAEKSDIVYAALTTDRGKKDAFATIIRKGGAVDKIALYQEGRTQLSSICRNMDDLEKCGLHCVQHKIDHNRIRMPFVQKNTVNDDLRKIIVENQSAFIKLIDRFYNCILRSSEKVDILHHQFKCPKELYADLGVILKKAYIDMVPINCFQVGDEFYFFDQEFVRENYPAKYVLYRTLKYTYLFHAEAEQILSINFFKQKYRLELLWKWFEEEEQRFVAANRNYHIYKHFMKWAAVNKSKIYGRF